MAWALLAVVIIAGIIIFIEALVLVIAKENIKEVTKKLDRQDLINVEKGDANECRKF